MRLQHAMRTASIFAFLPVAFCTEQSTTGPAAPQTGEGMCIYRADVAVGDDLSYQQFDPDTVTLPAAPIIGYDDIVTYDTASHVLTLARARDSLLTRPGVYGEAFVVTLDRQPLYGGFFWTIVSSVSCHTPLIVVDRPLSMEPLHQIRIERGLGYPESSAPDPRHNAALFARLAADGKAR